MKKPVNLFGCLSCMYRDGDGYCFNKYSPKATEKVDDTVCFLHQTDLEKLKTCISDNYKGVDES